MSDTIQVSRAEMLAKAELAKKGIRLAYLVPAPLTQRKFVPSVNLADIDDRKSSAYLRECYALLCGLPTIPKSTGKYHNRTLLADELNRLVTRLEL